MKDYLRIAVVGDFDPASPSQRATHDVLANATFLRRAPEMTKL